MKVLLTGASGQVGLAVQAGVRHGSSLTSLTRSDLDISRQTDVSAAWSSML
jgi:dTDP-4-dehydrorhamnose reductase